MLGGLDLVFFFGALAWFMVAGTLGPRMAATFGAGFTFALFAAHVATGRKRKGWRGLADDRLLAGVLSAATMFLLFLFA